MGNWVRQAREEAAGAPTAEERAEICELRRELERVTRERDILGKAVGLLFGLAPEERVIAMYTFIAEEQADPDSPWSPAQMCRVLAVSRSGFYDWQSRPPSDRQVSDALLAAEDRSGSWRARSSWARQGPAFPRALRQP